MRILVPGAISLAVLGALLAACSGGTGNGGSESDQGDGWGTQTNVQAIFDNSCSGCHGAEWTCWNVHDDASAVESAVSSGEMPRGNPLPATDKATLLEWLQAGAPCQGSAPANNNPVPIIGGAG